MRGGDMSRPFLDLYVMSKLLLNSESALGR